jgi:hypothetical protein
VAFGGGGEFALAKNATGQIDYMHVDFSDR